MLHDLVIAAQIEEMKKSKRYGEKAFAQLEEADFFFRLNEQQCSIAAYIRHLAGNMRSRFVDFLTSDGEKPTRDRDGEFEERAGTRAELMEEWDDGWAAVFGAIESLEEGDLEKPIYIRREPHSVILAITRQVAHYAWHVGQIVLLAKHIQVMRGREWQYMTIPPGGSVEFNRAKGM